MFNVFAVLESNVGKIGLGGILATLTLSEWSLIGGLTVAALTSAAIVPVVVYRWRKMLRGEPVETETLPRK